MCAFALRKWDVHGAGLDCDAWPSYILYCVWEITSRRSQGAATEAGAILFIPVAAMGKCKLINNSILFTVCQWCHLIKLFIREITQLCRCHASYLNRQQYHLLWYMQTCMYTYLSHAMFMSFRSLWNMRNYIHINLCISLIVAQVTFIAGVEPRGSVVGTSYASHMHLTTKFVQWWCLDWVEAFIPANTTCWMASVQALSSTVRGGESMVAEAVNFRHLTITTPIRYCLMNML